MFETSRFTAKAVRRAGAAGLTVLGLALGSAGANAVPVVIDSATYGGHTYHKLSADTWTASEAYAAGTLGGHLVTVNDAAENAFLISRFGSSTSLWLGLHRSAPHSPTFVWADGDGAAFRNWAGGEPNDCGACIGDPDGEQFVHTYASGQWNDLGNFSDYAGPKYGIVELAGATVPEPGALALLLLGMGALSLLRRREAAASRV